MKPLRTWLPGDSPGWTLDAMKMTGFFGENRSGRDLGFFSASGNKPLLSDGIVSLSSVIIS